jgi:hypothetical protein
MALLIHAEWDADLPSYMAQAYFAKLSNAPYKRFVELGEGTHTIIMEKNRMQFFHEVMAFLYADRLVGDIVEELKKGKQLGDQRSWYQ